MFLLPCFVFSFSYEFLLLCRAAVSHKAIWHLQALILHSRGLRGCPFYPVPQASYCRWSHKGHCEKDKDRKTLSSNMRPSQILGSTHNIFFGLWYIFPAGSVYRVFHPNKPYFLLQCFYIRL